MSFYSIQSMQLGDQITLNVINFIKRAHFLLYAQKGLSIYILFRYTLKLGKIIGPSVRYHIFLFLLQYTT